MDKHDMAWVGRRLVHTRYIITGKAWVPEDPDQIPPGGIRIWMADGDPFDMNEEDATAFREWMTELGVKRRSSTLRLPIQGIAVDVSELPEAESISEALTTPNPDPESGSEAEAGLGIDGEGVSGS